MSTFAGAAARVMLVEVGCALEKYRMAQGEYPQGLEQLVPDYLVELPVDPYSLDLKLLGYELESARYRLWSRGGDFEDDGGQDSDKDRIWRFKER